MRKAFNSLSFCAVVLCALLAGGRAQAVDGTPSFVYPQQRQFGPHKVVLHEPQLDSWTDFARFEGEMAIEFYPDGGTTPLLGTVGISARTEVDLAQRLVHVSELHVDRVTFATRQRDTASFETALRDGVRKGRLDVPLDVFLLSLDDAILDRPPPAGFSTDPPRILVSSTPAIVLFVNGSPVLTELSDTGLKLIVNANWPLVTNAKSSQFWLLDREVWMTAKKLAGPWQATRKLPKGLSRLPKAGEHAVIAAAVPAPKTTQRPSVVHVQDAPTELVVTDGEPRVELIRGAGGLGYVANSDSPLLKLAGNWYYLAAGRWFTTTDLAGGNWSFVTTLPAEFAAIPADHALAYVRAAVRGTLEAKVAALEALLPTRTAVAAGAPPAITVSYAGGKPEFQPIGDSAVSRAVNTGYDVLWYSNRYYLCHAGAWYDSATPTGPWTATAKVPSELYAIPPDSPAYHVTQVSVAESTPTTVTYVQTPAYSSDIYVVYGVPWYGTGYYYAPYAWGYYYYPYPIAYGHGSYYNAATGAYASRSVWYGPYGGYSYSQGYNPATGRHGYVETAWDGDEWASHGGTYNPRTGVSTETGRYYNANSNSSEMQRTVSRGDASMTTGRQTDFDARTSTTTRETSRGGSSEITHSGDGSGNRTSSGTIETAGGRTATIEGSGGHGQGSSSITGSEGGSATIDRNGNTTRTDFETAGGAQGTSISQGQGRTSVVESASGDLYAGHNGNVYRKSDDGWQSYDPDGGGWNAVERPERPQGGANPEAKAGPALDPASARSGMSSERAAQAGRGAAQAGPPDHTRLDRDAAARRDGMSSFQRNRSGGYSGSRDYGGARGFGGGGRSFEGGGRGGRRR